MDVRDVPIDVDGLLGNDVERHATRHLGIERELGVVPIELRSVSCMSSCKIFSQDCRPDDAKRLFVNIGEASQSIEVNDLWRSLGNLA
jgi:hypothetical protein